MDDQIITGGYRNSSIIGGPVNRCPVPFAFPFAPLGLGLFDADPSRILNLLHHQTLLAEEALRYRGVFVTPKESVRVNPIAEMLSKEQERLFKRNSHLRDNFRYPFTLPDLFPAQKNIQNDELNLNLKRNNTEVHDLYPADENIKNRSETVLKEGSLKFNSDFCINKAASKEMLDEILSKRSGSFLKEGLRFNPLSTNDVQYHQINNKEKSSNSSLTSSSPSIKPIPESLLMQDLSTIEEETKCTVCMATFPSVWLLEQHAALQHSNPMEEKPFICDQCGQSYRYRSAYVKHREQNHRARLPADKLFTCDVCGMQFRYLKSFKKHRLNHALERIHGKHEKKSTDELVSSSNEALIPNEDNVDLKGMIKEEDEDEEQDDTIDSASREDQHMADESQAKITSSEMEISNHNLVIPKPIPESTISTASLTGLLRPDATIGLNPQEASLLNFLRADAVDKQRERRFACPFCGKCVRSKENLKLHVRKHTGERPFVCLFCGRAFGGKSDLTRHLRIHTGERPYHCEACGKCFARADYLSKHLTTHLHNTSR